MVLLTRVHPNPDAEPASHPPSRGFTIIELIVVIGVVTILLALLITALSPARFEAKKVRSLNAGRQLFAATLMYTADYDDFFPYFATPGDPHAPPTCFGWTPPVPDLYFHGCRKHWASAVVADYFEAPPDDTLSTLYDLDRSQTYMYADAPEQLFPCTFLMTDTAFAAPEYWVTDEPPDDLSLIRGTRTTEVSFPALKGLMAEFARIGLVDARGRPLAGSADTGARQTARVLAVTGDGSAALRPFVTKESVQDAAVQRPFGCWNTYIFATRNGLRGRDW